MFQRLRERVAAWTERDDETGYVRSVLDASVLVGHGQGNSEARRELESVDEQAEKLTDARRGGPR